MAHLEKITITRWLDADGRKVRPGAPGAAKSQTKSKKYYGCYVDHLGKPRRKPLSTNKDAAMSMLTKILTRIELLKSGVVDSYQEHREATIESHLAAFEESMRLKGTSDDQVELAAGRVRRVMQACRFAYLGDIQAGRVPAAIAELRIKKRPLSTQTRNHYLTSLKSFGNWLRKDKRLPDNPFDHLEGGNADTDRRHDRQNLTAEQLTKLLETTKASLRVHKGLTGRDRHHLYLLAIYTGFRRDEIASLTPGSFDFTGDPVTVSLPMRETKNRQGAEQPLPRSIADEFAEYLKGVQTAHTLWPGKWSARSADMLKLDLADAGIAYEIEGPDGPQFADFHSLRHSFIGLFEAAGISVKSGMALARHTDPKLTMKRYGKARIADLGAAVEKLPILRSAPTPQEARATGTDGEKFALPVAQQIGPSLANMTRNKQKRLRDGTSDGAGGGLENLDNSPEIKRRDRDSNPGTGHPVSGFQDRFGETTILAEAMASGDAMDGFALPFALGNGGES